MGILKNKLNHFSVELEKERSEILKQKLQKETIEIHEYTYKIKPVESSNGICTYQLFPIALSSGMRNCFTPIIWVKITDKNSESDVVVTLRAYTGISIMLAVFCIGCIILETMFLIYLLHSVNAHKTTFTLNSLRPFISFLIIPLSMAIVCYFTFRNIRNAFRDEINAI